MNLKIIPTRSKKLKVLRPSSSKITDKQCVNSSVLKQRIHFVIVLHERLTDEDAKEVQ